MRAAARYLGVPGLGCALLACNPEPQAQPNAAAATDIEALPPDESVEAPPSEPANADAAEP